MDPAGLADRWQEFGSSAIAELRAVPVEAWHWPSGYEGWTAHDLLAHLSSTQQAIPRLVESAFSETAAGPSEPFDEDRWNASQVRRRREREAKELIGELGAGAVALTRSIEERIVAGADLQRPVPAGVGRGRPLGEVLDELLEHQHRHLTDLLESVRRSTTGRR